LGAQLAGRDAITAEHNLHAMSRGPGPGRSRDRGCTGAATEIGPASTVGGPDDFEIAVLRQVGLR
jgi:hypothetical protein